MRVVIIGGLHHNTLGVVRSVGSRLEKRSLYVLLVGHNIPLSNYIAASRYVEKSQVFILSDYTEIVDMLKKLETQEKTVVISCADKATEVIIKAKENLKEKYYLPDTTIDIDWLLDKENQDVVAAECGLNIPSSGVVSKGNQLTWDKFPCILKPLKSTIGSGKSDIRIADNLHELNEALITVGAERIQIQEYIEKKFEFQLIGCSLKHGEIILIPGYTRIIRQPRNTNTGYLEFAPIEDFSFDEEAVSNFIKKIGYSGLFSIEFIRGIDNKDYFLEINMRNDGNAYCVFSAGVNLPYIWCSACVQDSISENEITVVKKCVRFIPDFNDFLLGVRAVGIFKWISEFFLAESHSIYNKKDMKPFFTKLLSYLSRRK